MIGPENLLCVAPMQVPVVWPLVEKMIDAAYEVMDELTPDVQTWLIEEKGLLWVLVDNEMIKRNVLAACTTSLVTGRSGLYCRVVACGGAQCDWAGCIAAIERYAKAEGCYKMKFDGRRGWSRALPDYDPVCVSYEKRI